MKKLYLVTGATGHVGTVLVNKLLERREQVRALVSSAHRDALPSHAHLEVCYGDITDKASLGTFFDRAGYDFVTLIHCAALISIASKENPRVWETNVTGADHTMRLALDRGVDRVVYVSSVHSIPERAQNERITEVSSFSPDLVHGQYAKSKAAAAQLVLDYAKQGLPVSIVHPSGIIGPGDLMARNHMIRTIKAMAAGRIPVGLQGGYDFVDSRDVVQGILGCEEHGLAGECYILNGQYIRVLDLLNRVREIAGKKPVNIELPYGFVRAIAPVAERISAAVSKEPPMFTPYSVYTLHTNGNFSHEKARKAFGYCPRPIDESIRASL